MPETLTEYESPVQFHPQILEATEAEKANGWMRVRGRFQLADTKNGNGRVYSQALWSRVLGESNLHERIQGRQMRGELEHPADGVTNIGRVSHLVTGLKQEGKEIIGEALILNTPTGRILQELFRAGSTVGVSSRGRGTSYNRQGVEYVSEQDFVLDTFDFVDKPSTPGAFPALVESQVERTYLQEATMDAKRAEIRGLQVLAHEIQRDAGGANIEQLDGYSAQLAEAVEKAKVLKSHSDDLDEDGGLALSLLGEAQAVVAKKRQDHYLQESRRLDIKVESAMAGASAPQQERGVSESASSTSSAAPAGFVPVAVLQESERHRRFFQESATDLARRLDEGAVDGHKWRAAQSVLEAAVRRCAERDVELGDLLRENEDLQHRLTATEGLVEQIVSRNDEGRLLKRLREAFADCPDLERFKPQYDEAIQDGCSLPELNKMLQIHSNALSEMGMGYEDDDEFSMDDEPEMGFEADDEMGGDEWAGGPEDDAFEFDDPMGDECPDGDPMEMGEPEMGMDDEDPMMDPEEMAACESVTPHVRYESDLPGPGSVDAHSSGRVLNESTAAYVEAGGRRRLNESHPDPRVATARRAINRIGGK